MIELGADGISPGAKAAQQLLARESDIHQASRSLKAMSHPLRLKILCIYPGWRARSQCAGSGGNGGDLAK